MHPPLQIRESSQYLLIFHNEIVRGPAICFIVFGNFKWEVLCNNFDDSPFFSCDDTAAIEKMEDARILNRIVPLTPKYALRIRPDLAYDRGQADFSFSKFSCRSRKISRRELATLNGLIVRCAEDSVFYCDDQPWVRPFISKNRSYRIEPQTHKQRTPTGTLLVFTHRIAACTFPPEQSAHRQRVGARSTTVRR